MSSLAPSSADPSVDHRAKGNDCCHVILRGANSGPNYSAPHVRDCASKLSKAGVNARVMIDASHGNSEKKHERQLVVVDDVARQLESDDTASAILGVMIESNLVAGKQTLPPEGPINLTYGQSVTDGPPATLQSPSASR